MVLVVCNQRQLKTAGSSGNEQIKVFQEFAFSPQAGFGVAIDAGDRRINTQQAYSLRKIVNRPMVVVWAGRAGGA